MDVSTSMRKLLKGTLEDHYKIGAFLGKGGFGKVTRGYAKATGEAVALKFMDKALADEGVVMECMLLRLLGNHPNITSYFGVYETRDRTQWVIAMELMPGGELLEVLPHAMDSGDYSERDACVIIRQAIQAIDHCHRKNVAHCDLKLENLFCSDTFDVTSIAALQQARIKLGDFGAACVIEEGELVAGGVGTYNYMPPERLRKEGYTEKTDIWGLGVLLYALIAGALPFQGDTRQQIMAEVQKGPNYRLREFREVSPEVVAVLRRMLAVDMDERPSTVELLRDPWISGTVPATASLRATLVALRRANYRRKFRASVKALIAGKRVKRLATAAQVDQMLLELAAYSPTTHDIKALSKALFEAATPEGGPDVEEGKFVEALQQVMHIRTPDLPMRLFNCVWEYEESLRARPGTVEEAPRGTKRPSKIRRGGQSSSGGWVQSLFPWAPGVAPPKPQGGSFDLYPYTGIVFCCLFAVFNFMIGGALLLAWLGYLSYEYGYNGPSIKAPPTLASTKSIPKTQSRKVEKAPPPTPGPRRIKHLNFCLSALTKLPVSVEEQCRVAFEIVDRDNTGTISRAEYRLLVQSMLSMVAAAGTVDLDMVSDHEFSLADQDGSGCIGWEEFMEAGRTSRLRQRYSRAVGRMLQRKNEVFLTELEALRAERRGVVTLRDQTLLGGWRDGLIAIQNPTSDPPHAPSDGSKRPTAITLAYWRSLEEYRKGSPPEGTFPLCADCNVRVYHPPDALENVRFPPRIKLQWRDRTLLFEPKTRSEQDVWADVLRECGLQTVVRKKLVAW